MKKSIKLVAGALFGLILFSSQISAQAQNSTSAANTEKKLLQFKYKKGDRLALVSRVEEDVSINGHRQPHMTILNRVSMLIKNTDENGRGFYEATFKTTESFSEFGFARSVDWEEFESESMYWRNRNGKFAISKIYFMPIVRDMPIFPDTPVGIGDKWEAEGYEAEDFRQNFKIQEPVKVPFTANYEYVRDEKIPDEDGKETTYQIIKVKYSLMHTSDVSDFSIIATNPPVSTMGISDRTIWWDNEKGQIAKSIENFRITIESYMGDIYIFRGTTTSELTEFQRTATDDNVKSVQVKVDELGLENVSVAKTDRGLQISLENIQFEPDSAILRYTEQKKLRELAKILKSYPNDILVTGHTARVDDDEEACQVLSEERADSVANFLMKIRFRTKDHIFTEGFGSKRPIGDNATEEGRKKNRRVEITILDK